MKARPFRGTHSEGGRETRVIRHCKGERGSVEEVTILPPYVLYSKGRHTLAVRKGKTTPDSLVMQLYEDL